MTKLRTIVHLESISKTKLLVHLNFGNQKLANLIEIRLLRQHSKLGPTDLQHQNIKTSLYIEPQVHTN